MVQVCKGICVRYEAPTVPNSLRYKIGDKRCTICDCFFITKELLCICCNTRLRNGPRNRKQRAKLRVPSKS